MSQYIIENIEALTAVAVAVSAAIAGLAKYFLPIIQANRVKSGIRDINLCYDVLNELVDETLAGRAMLLGTENGGGIPRPGVRVKSTVYAEAFRKPLHSVREGWIDQPVDEQYARLLFDVLENDCRTLKTSLMKPGILRDLYVDEGIEHAHVHIVKVTKSRVFYLSIVWTYPESVSPAHRNAVRSAANRLARVLT